MSDTPTPTVSSRVRAWVLPALMVTSALLGVLAEPTSALAWDPFRTRNDSVEEGNARMADGDATGALASYDQAARELPNDPRVQLNRGLALMAQDNLPETREALLRAADPDAPAEVRADAYYDLGLAFFREGDAAATEEDHEAAQASFREAADSFRRSLRARPGNRDAAWNLEIALRRIREEEEKQEQQEQEQQEQRNQEQQNQDQQDQQNPDQQDQQDPDQPDPQDGEDPQNQESQDSQEEGEEGDEGEQESQDPSEGEGDEGDQSPDEGQGEDSPDGPEGDGADEQPEPQDDNGGQRLPGHVERVLDALEDDEESLQRARARARAVRDNRQVSMDW